MTTGDKVGAKRWPHGGGFHYGRPWMGTLLASNDPRAWEGTLAFHDLPTRDQVDAHIGRCRAMGLDMDTSVAVLWDFGDKTRVYWQSAESIRPYAEDLAAWEAANAQADAIEAARRVPRLRLIA